MVNKKTVLLRHIFIFLFFVFCSQIVFSEGFKQKVSWKIEQNASEYKVEIIPADGGKSTYFTTSENFVSFSMPAGSYKYRVTAYDVLGHESSVSEWQSFKITKAVEPVVKTPQKVSVPQKAGENFSISVDVQNIEEDSKVELINKATGKSVKGKLNTVKTGETVSSASVEFPKVSEGEWVVKVTNPSGLSTESSLIEVEDEAAVLAKRAAEEQAEKQRIEQEQAEKQRIEQEQKEKLEREKQLAEEKHRKEEELEAKKKQEEERIAREKEEQEKRRIEEERLAQEQKERQEQEERQRKYEEENPYKGMTKDEAEFEEEKKLAKNNFKNKKKNNALDLNIIAGAGMNFNFYDGQLHHFKSEDFYPEIKLKLSWLPVKIPGWRFGAELEVDGMQVQKTDNEYYEMEMLALWPQLGVLVQKELVPSTLYLNLKADAGIFFIKTKVGYTSSVVSKSPVDGIYSYISFGGALSVFWIPAKHLVIEAGGEFRHIAINDMPTGYASPFVCIGVRF